MNNLIINEGNKPVSPLTAYYLHEQYHYDSAIEPKNLRQLRAISLISNLAIAKQATLYSSIITSKVWATEVDRPIKVEMEVANLNHVYTLRQPTKQDEIVAYLKIGKRGELSISRMERLIWKIAVVLGVEELFAPTAFTEILFKPDLVQGDVKKAVWRNSAKVEHGESEKWELSFLEPEEQTSTEENGERLTSKESADDQKIGSIQPRLEGHMLYEYLNGGNLDISMIPMQEVIKATISTLFFQQYDAQSNNIILSSEGKPYFFDNTKCFPLSDGFFKSFTNIVSSYRNALLDTPQAELPLTSEDIEFIQSLVGHYEVRFEALKTYLSSQVMKDELAKFPPGWWDTKNLLNQYLKMAAKLKTVLAKDEPLTLQELVCQVVTHYKFNYAVTLLTLLEAGEIKLSDSDGEYMCLHSHEAVGSDCFDNDYRNLTSKGYDLLSIYNQCSHEYVTFQRLVDVTKAYFIVMQQIPLKRDQYDLNVENSDQLFEHLESMSRIDNKEQSRDSSLYIIDLMNKQTFAKYGLKFVGVMTPEELKSHHENHGKSLLFKPKGMNKLVIYIADPNQMKCLNLDLTVGENQVLVQTSTGGQLFTIEQFLQKLNLKPRAVT